MPHVNTGSAGGLTGRQRRQLEELQRLPMLAHLANSSDFAPNPEMRTLVQNCALCTAAGILHRLTGVMWTSGDVSGELGSMSETADLFVQYARDHGGFAGDDNVAAQIFGLGHFVASRTGRPATVYTERADPLPFYSVLGWMRNQRPGTVFGVWFKLSANSQYCHWVYAEKIVDGVLFTDFQTDHPEFGGRPMTGPLPVIGVLSGSNIATTHSTAVAVAF